MTCPDCDGSGHATEPCFFCGATGNDNSDGRCGACRGTGFRLCGECAGTGDGVPNGET